MEPLPTRLGGHHFDRQMLAHTLLASFVSALLLTAPAPREAANPDCRPESGDAKSILARAMAVARIPTDGRVLHYSFSDDISQNYQSDRMYPPYLTMQWGGAFWFDPRTRVQRLEERGFGLGNEAARPFVLLHGDSATYVVRDTGLIPNPNGHLTSLRSRNLDAWTVLRDWMDAADVRVRARCIYREWPRIVLSRRTSIGDEQLFIDPKSGLPVKLDRREPHYLWGDVHVEYLWTNWERFGGSSIPLAAWRLVDSETDIARSIGRISIVPSDSAPSLGLPHASASMPAHRTQPAAPDTVRVGPQTFLLVNPAYTNALALIRDTVWVLDAQLDEDRARQDAAWIQRLFPGRHTISLVVTDLAWPHIAGVRYWVARGATVYSHSASERFLRRVTERRWSLEPDSLERVRRISPSRAQLRFVPIVDSLRVAGGQLVLYAIDGLGSEGALMAWIPRDGFLWASDYVQNLRQPSRYAGEVLAATRRVGIEPARFAAMHLPLSAWSSVVSVHDESHP